MVPPWKAWAGQRRDGESFSDSCRRLTANLIEIKLSRAARGVQDYSESDALAEWSRVIEKLRRDDRRMA